MGRYLNITNKGFRESVQSEIYVDKTGLISYTNRLIDTEQKYLCISRPRRFGKSMTVKMLSAYYNCESDSEDLFQNLQISKDITYRKYQNQYDVLLLNMQEFMGGSQDMDTMLEKLSKNVCRELAKKYPNVEYLQMESLTDMMYDIFSETEQAFIILIDEWDCVLGRGAEKKHSRKNILIFCADG